MHVGLSGDNVLTEDVDLQQSIARWAVALTPDAIPTQVKDVSRRAIFDTLAVMVAASEHPSFRALAEAMPDVPGPCFTVGKARSTAETAAMLNGFAAHVWDFDDTSYTGIMHASAVILPAVLALTEEPDLPEDRLRTAFIAASEVTYYIAELCGQDHYFRGWWSTATLGTIGACVGAACLLDLNEEQMAEAIGLAACGGGPMRVLAGTDAKPFMVGKAAAAGIAAARTAALGLTGPRRVFEADYGFLAQMNAGEVFATPPLGQKWRLVTPGLFFKASPICSAAHAGAELLATLMSESGAEHSDILSIEAEVPDLVAISLIHDRPSNCAEAQFSMPYALACTALTGRLTFADLDPAAINDPMRRGLMQRVSMQQASDLSTEEMRKKAPECARLRVALRSGSVLSGFQASASGMPERPWDDAAFDKKMAECLAYANLASPVISVRDYDVRRIIASLEGSCS